MNAKEKKTLAIEQIISLQNESDIDEILKYLSEFVMKENNIYSLVEKLNLISQKYDETLKKLAQ